MNNNTRFLLAMLACILTGNFVTGCGFHLRGSSTTDYQATTGSAFTVLTEGDDVYDLFYPVLQRELEKARLLPNGATAADFIVHVGLESVKTRNLTVSTSGRAADNELTMTVPIMIARNGNTLAINKVSARRVYLYDTNAQLFSDRQAEALRVEMRNEISQRIIEQLRVLYRNPKPAAPEPAPVATTPDADTAPATSAP